VKASHIAPRAQDGVMKTHTRIPTGIPFPVHGSSPTRAYGAKNLDKQSMNHKLISQSQNLPLQYENDRGLDLQDI
jgi:hypothetical protein